MNLLAELRWKCTATSEDAPYVVLSRDMLERIIVALEQPPAEDALLLAIQNIATPIEFRMWRALYVAKGKPVSTTDLRAAAGVERVGTLWVHVRRLRAKLRASALGKIETVRGRGYYLELNSD